MRLSLRTLRIVGDIIVGEAPPRQTAALSPYRTMAEVVDLFEEHCGEDTDIYWKDRTPQEYCLERLKQANGSRSMDALLCGMLKFWEQKKLFDPKRTAGYLNELLWQDGYELVFCQRSAALISNKKVKKLPYFKIREIIEVSIGDQLRDFLQHHAISDHLEKAKHRLLEGDYDGAISIAYTLTEAFLKTLLRKMPPPFNALNENEGNVTALHKSAAKALNLSPSGEAIGRVAQGLATQVGNLYGLANKAGDRHDAKHKPGRHHAKLAVNLALSYCEFMLEIYENQTEAAAGGAVA